MSNFPARWPFSKLLTPIIGLVSTLAADTFPLAAERDNSAVVRFDIPAQPLAAAVEAYSATTGIVGVYNGNLAAGRRSHAIRGAFTPEEALRRLLFGDGLVAHYITRRAFVLVLAPAAATENNTWAIAFAALSRQNAAERLYSGLVQAGINRSLCGIAQARPGAYRLAIKFWIGSSGRLQLVRLLDSTGDRQRDDAILESLSRASIGMPPPIGMAQPFTMILLPRSAGAVIDCPSTEGRQNG